MIRTERLELIPATEETVRLAIEDFPALGRALGADVPASWPHEHLDAAALRFMQDRLRESPSSEASSWWMYFVLRGQEGAPPLRLIGTAGYKGPPSEGTVEIGYGLVAEEHRRGYATEAAQALIARAFATPGVKRVIAETLADGVASIGVLKKCGFVRAGEPAAEPGAVRWELFLTP